MIYLETQRVIDSTTWKITFISRITVTNNLNLMAVIQKEILNLQYRNRTARVCVTAGGSRWKEPLSFLVCSIYLAWLDKNTLARGCGGTEESGEGVGESDKAGQEDKWSRERRRRWGFLANSGTWWVILSLIIYYSVLCMLFDTSLGRRGLGKSLMGARLSFKGARLLYGNTRLLLEKGRRWRGR